MSDTASDRTNMFEMTLRSLLLKRSARMVRVLPLRMIMTSRPLTTDHKMTSDWMYNTRSLAALWPAEDVGGVCWEASSLNLMSREDPVVVISGTIAGYRELALT